MKQLIVLIATIMLGLFLFGLIAGHDDASIYSAVRQVWVNEIGQRTVKEVGDL